MITLIIISLIAWYLSGVFSFIYWWRHDYDFTTEFIPFACFIGFTGPMAFFVGWSIHGNRDIKEPKIIFPRKR